LTPFTLPFIAQDQKKVFGAPTNSDLWHVPFSNCFPSKVQLLMFYPDVEGMTLSSDYYTPTPYSDHYKKLHYLSLAIRFAPNMHTP
jgi:hypothetical protein